MTRARPAGDQVTISLTVAVEPAAAFRVFTQETDLWWQRGPAYRAAGRSPGTLCFEPRMGGRLFESFDAPDGPKLVEFGLITAWEPPSRLMFNWRSTTFKAGESTEVEVTFEPTASGTRVTVQHRGWAAIRADHPVRHGQPVAAFQQNMGMWWTRLLRSLRDRAEQ